jgi:hypothetical protein
MTIPSLQSLAYFHMPLGERDLLPNFIRNECLALNLRDLYELLNIAQQNKNHTRIYKYCDACSPNIAWWDP